MPRALMRVRRASQNFWDGVSSSHGWRAARSIHGSGRSAAASSLWRSWVAEVMRVSKEVRSEGVVMVVMWKGSEPGTHKNKNELFK